MSTKIKSTNKKHLMILCESGITLALATVLSLIQIWHSPYGGSVTLLSMLPIVLVSLRHGWKIGLSVSFTYSLIQLGLDLAKLMGYGMTAETWIGSIIFDYIVAFSVLGLVGVWKKRGTLGKICGVAFVIFLRYLSHVVSGYIFFGMFAPDGWSPLPYSLFYNAVFMLPELISTVAASTILFKLPAFKKYMY